MSTATGQKAKLVNALDNAAAEDLVPLYSIDVYFGKSDKGVKCGGITIFKLNNVDLRFTEKYDLLKIDSKSKKEMEEAQNWADKQTEVMQRDPIFFREPDGQWIGWALEKTLALYDELGGSCRIAVKCPRLHIKQTRSSSEISRLRANPRELFSVAFDIDRLLNDNYAFDPWTKKIRRGRINAMMSKR